jgi:hypothetical protein
MAETASEESAATDVEFEVSLPTPDEFDRVETAIQELLAEHGVRELERLGHRARLLELRDALSAARQRLGDEERWRGIDAHVTQHWRRTRTALLEGLEWPIRAAAGRFAVRERGVLGQAVRQAVVAARAEARGSSRSVGAEPADDALSLDTAFLADAVWDDWTQDKLAECVDAVEVELRRSEIAATPVRTRLDATIEQAGQVVLQDVRDRLRVALARPGTRLQRGLRRVTGFMMAALPLFALLWVAYNVAVGYYRASTGASSYLGTDFAVSSVMLILVAWGVPFFCDRLLRPSLERAALRAMRRGLVDGLDRLGEQLRDAVGESARQAQRIRDDANGLIGEISRCALQPVDAAKAPLSRLLATPARSPAT